MTDLMKKAARAVVDTDLLSGGCHGDKMWAGEEVVRAVLMAVREPDGAVFNRANEALFDAGEPVAHETVHAAMIDAILADGEGR